MQRHLMLEDAITHGVLKKLTQDFKHLEKAIHAEISKKTLLERAKLVYKLDKDQMKTFLYAFGISNILLYLFLTSSKKGFNDFVESGDGIPAAGAIITWLFSIAGSVGLAASAFSFYEQPMHSLDSSLKEAKTFLVVLNSIHKTDITVNDSIEQFLKQSKTQLALLHKKLHKIETLKQIEVARLKVLAADLRRFGLLATTDIASDPLIREYQQDLPSNNP